MNLYNIFGNSDYGFIPRYVHMKTGRFDLYIHDFNDNVRIKRNVTYDEVMANNAYIFTKKQARHYLGNGKFKVLPWGGVVYWWDYNWFVDYFDGWNGVNQPRGDAIHE